MPTAIGTASRLSIFKEKLATEITKRTANPKLSMWLDPIQFRETSKPEYPLPASDLPCFRFRWQGISQGHTYESIRSNLGRLEITLSHARVEDTTIAEDYLEAVNQEITDMLYKRKQFFGIMQVSPLLAIPGLDPLNAHVVQLTAQYELRIL